MSILRRLFFVFLWSSLVAAGCGTRQSPTVSVTQAANVENQAPPATPVTADTPAPTSTPAVLDTPEPTYTPVPVDTPTAVPTVSANHKMELGEIESAGLAGNLIGDPSLRKFAVLLPPGYEASDQRYPVVYVLHGYEGNQYSFEATVEIAANRLHKEGTLKDMIYVFPDASTAFGGSYYMSSPTIGDYDTYLSKELVDQVDSTYRTIPERTSRGIVGCSMGGEGSLALALKNPEVYDAVAALSGAHGSVPIETDEFLQEGRKGFRGPPTTWDEYDDLDRSTRVWLTWASFSASNPDKPPFYLDMPFEIVDGEPRVVEDVARKIMGTANDHLVLDYVKQPTRLGAILLNNNPSDDMAPFELVSAFSQQLTDLGVDHELQEVTGSHCNQDWAPVLQWLDQHLVHEE